MIRFFLNIFDWFENHKSMLYISLLLVVGVCIGVATQIKFDENIYSFFGDEESSFKNLKFKDKIVVEVSGTKPDSMILAAEDFVEQIEVLQQNGLIGDIISTIDETQIFQVADYIYSYLPIFIDEDYYAHIDTLISDTAICSAVSNSLNLLLSPGGMMMKDFILRDPLNIATPLLSDFQSFNSNDNYEIYADYLFDKGLSSLYLFINPIYDMGNTGENDEMVSSLENIASNISSNNVEITCFGGHIIAVHNARQVKKDTILTLSIALIIIIIVIFFAFKNKKSIPLIIVPPVFGALFAIAVIVVIKGSVSAIAIGLGSIVLGVALSYSIHVIAHANHVDNPKTIISDLAYPLTVGCITTIGAFVALIFTNSQLLRDLGLFAALALVGTTLFCLIYLPHFLTPVSDSSNKFLNFIERCNAYDYEDNKWIIAIVTIVTIICLFFFNDVQFDADLNSINYVPEQIQRAESKMQTKFGSDADKVFLISSVTENSWESYTSLNSLCDSFLVQKNGSIQSFVSLKNFVIPFDIQKQRIEKWENYWSEERVDATINSLNKYASLYGFSQNAFNPFLEILTADYEVCEYDNNEMAQVPIIADWISKDNGNLYLVSSIELDECNKDQVYSFINKVPGVTIVDRSYFSSKMIKDISDDFNFILWVSSLLVFITLLIIYGRLETALLTFMPMCISWVIILGIMSICGIKFNIVNIILATLIFGIGDDFSIFIMDGLQQEYKNGTKILGMHKTAIFFSAFTTIVGIGVLVLAKHPAMKSIALLSMIGICVVVIVAYTIQPFLFRMMVLGPTKKGNFPITIKSFLCSILPFLFFGIGSVLSQLLILLLTFVPISKEKKRNILHVFVQYVAKIVLFTAFHIKFEKRNFTKDTLSHPAVIVSNHKSFIDVLLFMQLYPKIVVITSDWVWKFPLFAFTLRYAGYFPSNNGYDKLSSDLLSMVNDGYSVLIFPEGTRSYDENILRFHKGAFYLSEKLKLDILPVAIYGAGLVLSKQQNFYLKPGCVTYEFLPRIAYDNNSFGETYQEKSKSVRRLIVDKYNSLFEEFATPANKYYREQLMYNYIYKGRDEEFSVRKQLFTENGFIDWHLLVPLSGVVTVLGCGSGSCALMLAMLSKKREIFAFDVDEEKIKLASHCFAKSDNLSYFCSDFRNFECPDSDCIVVQDLHNVIISELEQLLLKCSKHLNKGGKIIFKSADSEYFFNGKISVVDLTIAAENFGFKHVTCKGSDLLKVSRLNKNSESYIITEKYIKRNIHSKYIILEK